MSPVKDETRVCEYTLNNETFKIQLYFDSYNSSTDWQWNEKCKKLYTTRSIKKHKKEKGWTQKKNKML